MRPTWVEVDLDAIRHNVRVVAAAVAPAAVCAVVKADAYGHGDVPVAETALGAGAAMLAVALVEEGARLREAGIEAPILLLSEPPPPSAPEVVAWGLTPTVYSSPFVAALAEAASHADPVAVHVKVDTGMHRVGAPPDTAIEVASAVAGHPALRLGGVWTHLAVAEEDDVFTQHQLEIFGRFLAALAERGIEPGIRHAANTAGALRHPASRYDMVRLGLGTYGLRPAPDVGPEVELRPAMRVVSHVSHLQRLPAGARPSYGRRRSLPAEATVDTAPIGYADGVVRRLSAVGGEVLVGGRRRPFAGTVTMDQIVIDVGDDAVAIGDEVVLLGVQGAERITAEEWAERLATITYEIVCGFGPRLPRRYLGGVR